MKDLFKGFKRLPADPRALPVGTQLVPACRYKEDAVGFILLPPEDMMNKEGFEKWKEELINNTIDLGLKDKRE